MTSKPHPWPRPLPGTAVRPQAPPAHESRRQRRIILASSLGTVFEWYDFYLFGALAVLIARHFFGAVDPSAGYMLALLTLAAGFVVRPLGALVFGRVGDLVGRKYTFLVTIVVMGLSTFMVGVLPGADSLGLAAPVLLVGLRLLQGLALGGEYGGAAVYVAEHAPAGRRGQTTAWIQTTATLGLLLALLVILGTRAVLGDAAFDDWGWRVPFLLSIVLLAVSSWIRLSMAESPLFQQLRDRGDASSGPVRDSLLRWGNLRWVLLALFGLVAGQAVVWYAGQLYVLLFLQDVLRIDHATASLLVAVALLIVAPAIVAFGALSDRIGRKPVLAAGLLLALVGLVPLYKQLAAVAHPALAHAQAGVPVVVRADPATCRFQLNPVATADAASGCDLIRRTLTDHAAHFVREPLPAGRAAELHIGDRVLHPPETAPRAASGRRDHEAVRAVRVFQREVADALVAAGYPAKPPVIALGSATWWRLVGLLVLLGLPVAMVYGPTAATLVELFPTRVRYTSVSLPYHLGNGWFGGLLPGIAYAMTAGRGDIFQGLWYPVAVAAFSLLVLLLWLPETRGRDLDSLR